MALMELPMTDLQFLLRKKADLERFTLCPDQKEYWDKQARIEVASKAFALLKMIKSSANKR